MKNLAQFIVQEITGSKDFQIEEIEEDDKVTLNINSSPELIGIIIGKNGRVIKAIQNILRVKGKLEKKSIFVNVVETSKTT